ncbi:MAG: thiamine pyrophosphate-dependent enzyme [bacterium]
MKKISQKYESTIKPVWCPGCGNYGILKSVKQVFAELDIPPENIMNISGIGCSGRFSHYFNTYSLHGTHGRALPTGLGAKAARKDMSVVVVGGDGDGLGIGGGHIVHTARKNVDITYILVDNRVYGLTKGQTSPTTPVDAYTKTSPYGVYDTPVNPIPMFITYDISFIARTSVVEYKRMTEIIRKAIEHKGMSMVYVLSPCITYPILALKQVKSLIKPLPDNFPVDDQLEAMKYAYAEEPLYTGIFYQIKKTTLNQHLENQISTAHARANVKKGLTIKELLKSYT